MPDELRELIAKMFGVTPEQIEARTLRVDCTDEDDTEEDDGMTDATKAILSQTENQEVFIELTNAYREKIATSGYEGTVADAMLMSYHSYLLHMASHA